MQCSKKISSFSFKNIDEFSTASLTTRLTNDVTMIQNMTMMILRMLIRMPSMLIVASFFAVSINPRLASMLFVCTSFNYNCSWHRYEIRISDV